MTTFAPYVRSLLSMLTLAVCPVFGQVNSGSDGHDGALAPTADLVIDMADHPDGIYHYTSVNIPSGVTVSFIPNAGNRPVVWLLQGDCVIGGGVAVNGEYGVGAGQELANGQGGPGGFNGGTSGTSHSPGQGPGAGVYSADSYFYGHSSYATLGTYNNGQLPGNVYGNKFLIPLLGGSGGGGLANSDLGRGPGGGGGAILIAATGVIRLSGQVDAVPGDGFGSAASGGAIRLVASRIEGAGRLHAYGGVCYTNFESNVGAQGGDGRVRIDSPDNQFNGIVRTNQKSNGTSSAAFTTGYQPIIIPAAGQSIQLAITSIAGVAVPANPGGTQAKPDVVIPGQQSNPVPIVVKCTNVPLNTEITVVVQPTSGAAVQAVALNKSGTLASSTATVSVNLPRGVGNIYAKAVTGLASTAAVSDKASKTRNIAQTGWTADGETFAQVEVKAELGGTARLTYLTESGKRYAMPQ